MEYNLIRYGFPAYIDLTSRIVKDNSDSKEKLSEDTSRANDSKPVDTKSEEPKNNVKLAA